MPNLIDIADGIGQRRTGMAKHFGKWLKTAIAAKGMPTTVFAERAGISTSRLYDWFKSPSPELLEFKLAGIAKALGIEFAAVKAEYLETRYGLPHADPDQNIEVGSTVALIEPPTFDRDLAAGHWTEAIFVGEREVSLAQIEQGLFRVRLSGDSMQPKYKNGTVVEFRVIRSSCDGLAEGADFYIQRDDELATFKRVEKINEETVVLRAINRKKYREPMMVERSRIVRCARAVAIIKTI